MAWGKAMVSLELDDEDKMDAAMPIPMSSKPDFPFGTRICLTSTELSKLGLDADCEVGEELEFMARARVTSVTKSDMCSRVELQIEDMAVQDSEED